MAASSSGESSNPKILQLSETWRLLRTPTMAQATLGRSRMYLVAMSAAGTALTALQVRDERPQKLLDAGVDVAAVEGGEAVADELEEGVHDVAQRLNGGCGFGRQFAIVQCLDVLAVIKHAVKLPFAELLYKVASRSLIFLGFSKSSMLQHSCPFGYPRQAKGPLNGERALLVYGGDVRLARLS